MKSYLSIFIRVKNQSQATKYIFSSNIRNNLFQRNIKSSSNTNASVFKKKEKKKVTVIKRLFYPDGSKKPEILEFQDAAKTVKRYNWENKCLFGPIQSSQTNPCNETKIIESNKIIQHQTNLPIVEPCIKSKLNSTHEYETYHQIDFEKILQFPLLNKISNEFDIGNKVDEFNSIRKHLENKCNLVIPSITKILEKTMPKESAEALARWKRNMIEELGEEGFKKYRNELLQNGASLHANINSYLAATPEDEIEINENNHGHWRSLKSIFPHISNVKLLEEKVSHPFLCYKGVVDCFAMYRNHLVVIDWKTSKKAKLTVSSTFDNPLQIAAYVGALNFDPKFQYLADKGLIVVAYEDGKPATAHLLDKTKLLQYWKGWLKRIQLYWSLSEITENKL